MEKKQAFLIVDENDLPLIRETLQRPLAEIGRFPIKGVSYLLFFTL